MHCLSYKKTNLATANPWRCKESLKWVRRATTPRAAAWRLTNFLNYYKELLKEKVYGPIQKALRTIESKRKMIEQRWKSSYSNARLEGLEGDDRNAVLSAAASNMKKLLNLIVGQLLLMLTRSLWWRVLGSHGTRTSGNIDILAQ